MKFSRRVFVVAGLLALSGCGNRRNTKFRTYNGPEVTKVLVYKTSGKLYLMHGDIAIRAYEVDFGFTPDGHKRVSGDGRTPEGHYRIDRRNPNSDFHLSLGISYPNARDIALARARGVDPGGDIFVHGRGKGIGWGNGDRNWTRGCIAVTDDQMEEIYAMVKTGTPISIYR